MFPDLIEVTHVYWRKLDALEAAYQRGEVSLEEVDTRVAELMAELAEERRAAMGAFLNRFKQFWVEQREVVLGLGVLAVLTYAWVING